MLLEGVILTICKQMNGARSNAAIYYIVTGKKSMQALQDIHLYELEQLYGIFKSLSLGNFNKIIEELLGKNYIAKKTGHIILTKQGEEWLNQNKEKLHLDWFDGIRFYKLTNVFAERLCISIQILSNRNNGNTKYIPIADNRNTLNWAKQFYQHVKWKHTDYAKQLYGELKEILEKYPDTFANFFVDHLTGFKVYGKSSAQLALIYHMRIEDVSISWVMMIHQILKCVKNDHRRFPVIYYMMGDVLEMTQLSSSSKQTYRLLRKGRDPKDIAGIRMLKLNTIYDHIIEISIFDQDFNIEKYVTNDEVGDIAQVIRKLNTSSLKIIKSHLPEDISYFKIRLALTRI